MESLNQLEQVNKQENNNIQNDVIQDNNIEQVAQISKRQLKKQLKSQKWQEKQAFKKENQKKKQKKNHGTYEHLKRFNRANQIQAELEKSQVQGDDNKQDLQQNQQDNDEQVFRKTTKKEKQQMFKELCKQGPKYIIDCEFEDLMQDRELKSLSQQLAYCHSVNKKMQKPLNIILTGVEGKLKSMIEKSNCQNWAVDIKYETKYIDLFEDKSKLVYLTADSENLIEQLDDEMTYIVGGIVDHNRYKLLTYKKATSQGIKHARLPIRENIQLTHSAVLTVNHVFEIIAAYYKNNGNWKNALLEAIPERKRKALEEGKEGDQIEEQKKQDNDDE